MNWPSCAVGGRLLYATLAVLASLCCTSADDGGPRLSSNDRQTRIDYEDPKLVIGTIYEQGSPPARVLFRFRRTATRSGETVRILREYLAADGSLAARERVTYENGLFASCEMEECQTGAKGSAVQRPDPQHGGLERLHFEYTSGPGSKTERKKESVRGDVLINDMLPLFIRRHWVELTEGATVKFRLMALTRAETVGFKLVKEGQTTWRNQPVISVRMEPTSIIIARLVEPLHFTIEAGGEHRIVQYTGRTTPMIKRANKWVDLDAVTIFDWDKPEARQ